MKGDNAEMLKNEQQTVVGSIPEYVHNAVSLVEQLVTVMCLLILAD